MKRNEISVALAAYNGAKFIAEQIESIAHQSVPVHEIIVCDDGSADGTVDIVGDLKRRFPNVRLVAGNRHVGLNKNFELAIRQCTGPIIALSDQDNVWETQKIEKMLDALQDHILVYSDSLIVDEAGRPMKRLTSSKKYRFTDGKSPKEFYFYNAIFGHNIVFRRELIEHILPFPEAGLNYDGWLAFVASCVGSIGYIDEPLVRYRMHPGNLTHPSHAAETPSIPKAPKWQRRQRYNQRLVEKLEVFAPFDGIQPAERRFLSEFISELRRLEYCHFNFRLLWMMLFNSAKLLHYKVAWNAIGKAFSQSIGIKRHRRLRR